MSCPEVSLPEKDISPPLHDDEGEETEEGEERAVHLDHQSSAFRPLTFGNWMFDVVATGSKGAAAVPAKATTTVSLHSIIVSGRISRSSPFGIFGASLTAMPTSSLSAHAVVARRLSLQFTRTTATASHPRSTTADYPEEKELADAKSATEKSDDIAQQGRGEKRVRARWDISLTAVAEKVSGQRKEC